MYRLAPQQRSASSFVTYIIGPYASIALNRQPIVAMKTKQSINVTVQGITMSQNPTATLATSAIAAKKTRKASPTRTTGSGGKSVVATLSKNTGAPPR